MVKNLLKILVIFGVAIAQILIMPYFGIHGVWPNLVLILALMLLFFDAQSEALFTASLGGVILDFASPLIFGYFTLMLVLLTLLVKLLMNKFLKDPNIFIMILIMAFSLFVFDSVQSLIVRQYSFAIILPNIFYGLIISLIFYRLLNFWIDRNQAIRL